MPLYKYLPRRYLDAFLNRGSLKIGTLYEYRQVEAYGHVIGDKNEGLHKTELFLPGGGESKKERSELVNQISLTPFVFRPLVAPELARCASHNKDQL